MIKWKMRRDCRPSDSTVSEDAGIKTRSSIIAAQIVLLRLEGRGMR